MLSISYRYCHEVEYNEHEDLYKNADLSLAKKYHSGEIGFIDLPEQEEVVAEIKEYIKSIPENIDTFLLLGIGGSALGNMTIYQALGSKNSNSFYCIDNVDPDSLKRIMDTIKLENTLVNVVSKSGGTPETIANFFLVYEQYKQENIANINHHFVFTTDPDKGFLNKVARKYNIKRFYIPENVGGRFSIQSPVGLLMMGFLGHDIELFLEGAKEIKDKYCSFTGEGNPVAKMALGLYKQNVDKQLTNLVLMPYSNLLKEFSSWFKQLWAESLGKKHDINGRTVHVGQTPVSSVGATDQHSIVQLMMEGPKDKITVFIKIEEFFYDRKIDNPFPEFDDMEIYSGTNLSALLNFELQATAFALNNEDRPSIEISIPKLDEYYLGQLFYFFELLTAYSGEFYKINAFDQPGVEAGKIATKALLGQDDLIELKNEILNNSTK